MSGKKPSIAILGMSPGNSYFKESVIRWLTKVVTDRFESFRIMIPDHPAEYTYRAKGQRNPTGKALAQWNAIRNRIERVLGKQGQEEFTLNWKEQINTHPAYRRSVKEVLRLCRNNTAFKDALEMSTKEVLQWWDTQKEISQKNTDIWVKFLICELAFLSAANEVLGSDVTYVYHRPWPIFHDFMSGKFDGKVRPIDFEIIAGEEEV